MPYRTFFLNKSIRNRFVANCLESYTFIIEIILLKTLQQID